MSKRRSSKEDKWRRKLKKYEQKLKENRRTTDERDSTRSMSSSPNSHRSRRRSRTISPDRALSPCDTAPASIEMEAVEPTTKADTPEDPTLEIDALPSADPQLLQALGLFEAESDEWGPDIVDELSKRWEPTLKAGLKKEIREEILKKYLFPKNCQLMRPPALNPEIAAVLNESAKNRDGRLVKKQAQLGCIFSILGRTMSDILTKSINMPEVLKNLSDMAKMLADSHYSETETRRSLITPMVDKAFIEPFKDRKRDTHLFGEKLGDFIKSSRGIQKTGKLIQPSTTSSSNNLNSKGPAPRYQQHRSSRQAHRAGETRALQYQQFRRRAPFQPSLNNRTPPVPPAQKPNRKQAAPTTYKHKQ